MDTFDVVVLGTGAAGLTAAIAAHASGATVAVFEKSDQVGGTTAWSGGMVWVPCNPHMAELGIDDSRDEALTYLHSLSHGLIDEKLAAAYIDAGPEMVAFVEAESPVTFSIIPGFPDYHPEHPGAKPGGGRSLECSLFSFDQLGPWADKVTIGPQIGRNISMSETSLGRGAPGGVPAAELARRQQHDERGAGQGLTGRLLKGCLDRGIEPRTEAAGRELVVENGRVVGLRLDTPDGELEVGVRGGVVLATGGFEWDRQLVRSFVRSPMTHPVSVKSNTGDGLRMAMRAGASLGCMPEAWWVPVIEVPKEGFGTVAWQVNGERTRPHCIMVNRRGQRFTNEAANYNAFGEAFHVMDVSKYEFVNHPAWMLFDHHYLTRYGLAGHTADAPTPVVDDRGPVVASCWRSRSGSPATPSRRPCRVGTRTSPPGTTPISGAVRACTTVTGAIRRSATTCGARWGRSIPHRSSPCRFTAVRWAQRAARAPTAMRECSTSTTDRLPASTRPAT